MHQKVSRPLEKGPDRYRRIVGKVLAEGNDVSLQQIKASMGLALQVLSGRAKRY